MITRDPEAEIQIDELLVSQLIQSQFPDLAGLSIAFMDSGWDNESYRLGSSLMVRLPRRNLSEALLINEINWLPQLQKKLPIPIPAPLRVGKPEFNYPWQWTIVPWYEGVSGSEELPIESEAMRLIEFLKALHMPVKNAPINRFRGDPLHTKSEAINERVKRLRAKTDLITQKISNQWQAALEEPYPTEQLLIHGDLHSRNVIVKEGIINAIIDWGDITSGDAATDLACLWMLFPNPEVRYEALMNYGASPSLIIRSRGWAIFFAITLLDTGLDSNPKHVRIGELTLKHIADEL